MAYETPDKIVDFSPVYRFITGIVFWTTLVLIATYDILFFRLKVKGRSNLEKVRGKGCFLISNHSLYFDPGIIAHVVAPRRSMYSAMLETFQIRYLGSFIRALGAFPIPESMGLRKLIRPVKTMLDKGWFVHFFPEGEVDLTRLNTDIETFHPGVFFLANLLKAPVVPIVLVSKRRRTFGEKMSRFFVDVIAVVAEPIYPDRTSGGKQDGTRQAIELMTMKAHKIMSEIIERY
jgi:1-acyl-sn-glycerol-3-phosphate acyltransferase